MVAVAASDVEYRESKDQGKREAQIVRQMFSGSREGIFQGIYVATPSGILLGRVNAGWPDPDTKVIFQNIQRCVQQYYQMPRTQRLMSSVPDSAKDRMVFAQSQFTKPADTLDLRVTKRGYSYPGMTTFDERHPKFMGIDRLWFKPTEWYQFFPRELKVGNRVSIKGDVLNRWVLHNHMQKGASAWDASQIRSGTMTSEVTGVKGNLVDLTVRASYSMKANTQWNVGSYDGSLLGYIQYDLAAKKFTRFEAVMFGYHDAGKFEANLRSGDLKQWVASYATLNPLADSDDRMLPSNWMWGYGLNWCKTQ